MLLSLLCLVPLAALNAPAPAPLSPPAGVIRRDLLTAEIAPPRPIAAVAIKQITLPPHLAPGLHLHPCPVVGIVTAGKIAFQIEGGPVQHLRPGDAFYEPADARIVRFDNEGDTPAIFSACYLLGDGQHEMIRLLPH